MGKVTRQIIKAVVSNGAKAPRRSAKALLTKEYFANIHSEAKTVRQMAAESGFSETAVRNGLIRNNAPYVKRKNIELSSDVLRQEVESKVSYSQMAKRQGCSPNTAKKRILAMGLKSHEAQVLENLTVEEYTNLRNLGLSKQQIAERLGLSSISLEKWLSKHKIPQIESSITPEFIQAQDILDLRPKGADANFMAQIFGISEREMQGLIKKFHLEF